ncbi:MAG: hypothetical protein ACYC61_32550 [Isosphaeraceae bacterium]
MAGGVDEPDLDEWLARRDPAFVDRLRRVSDAIALAGFAARWYADRSPEARRLLFEYLDRPLNAYRHEGLVKRLFKLAEAAGDDAVMARFLVAFDRSVRRVQRYRHRRMQQQVETEGEAKRLAALWKAEGCDWTGYWPATPLRLAHTVVGTWREPRLVVPGGTTMPRGRMRPWTVFARKTGQRLDIQVADWVFLLSLNPNEYWNVTDVPDDVRARLEQRFRLFSIPTRYYLRRRSWRYFRRLGRTNPDRYVAAISEALALYRDDDVASGSALLDNWGLIHALFHNSRVLVARPRGWILAKGRSLANLEPAPIFEDFWRAAPRALFDLVVGARCRPVRQWAAKLLMREVDAARSALGVVEVLELLDNDEPAVVEFAAEWLRGAADLASISPERWLAVAMTASPAGIELLAEIMARQIAPEQVSTETATRLAAGRALPLARLGLTWLKAHRVFSEDERRGLLALLEAECEPLRPEILAWLLGTVAAGEGESPVDALLEFLDSRHADARAIGLRWFRDDLRARDDVTLWQRLLESPHDDVRLALASELGARLDAAGRSDAHELRRALDPERVRLLWASVLLNVQRGGRAKPGVVRQVADRLGRRPDEAALLLPMLAVALRSVRAPERRSALAAVVRLVETRPEAEPIVRQWLPELQWT